MANDPARKTLSTTDLLEAALYGSIYDGPNNQSGILRENQRWDSYQRPHVPLLDNYVGRDLSYESDSLSAFTEVLRAEEPWLGPCHVSPRKSSVVGCRKHSIYEAHAAFETTVVMFWMQLREGFPSWSWTGWRLPKRKEVVSKVHANGLFHAAIHI
jgi:hypothetical protein